MITPLNGLGILGIKPGHDGSFAWLESGKLQFCIEAEKDNHPRYGEINGTTTLKVFQHLPRMPEVLAYSGWSEGKNPTGRAVGSGYFGISPGAVSVIDSRRQNGRRQFSSSHERSHILCAYAMSPFAQGQPCYALVWEGHIGAFYFIDSNLHIEKLCDILPFPGIRYAFLYGLADPGFNFHSGQVRLGDAGKLMAICSYASAEPVCEDGLAVVNRILDPKIDITALDKRFFINSRFHNCGTDSPWFANVAKLLSDKLYSFFENEVRKHVVQKIPLLISGGCGLNCDWNYRWMTSQIFTSVFIPPCANDSGSAIGTAADAQWTLTGSAKIEWSPYAGEYPEDDSPELIDFTETAYQPELVAQALSQNKIIGWMRGRYEIGPRALGARSIIASPARRDMLDRLNRVKRREAFRPIAPICLADKMADYFYPTDPSPYMLEFRQVVSSDIPAVRHVDGSSRPQSVSREQNPELHRLLTAFQQTQGIAVLCNTSLNFNGCGFLNKLSDLVEFSLQHGLDGFVFNDRFFLKNS